MPPKRQGNQRRTTVDEIYGRDDLDRRIGQIVDERVDAVFERRLSGMMDQLTERMAAMMGNQRNANPRRREDPNLMPDVDEVDDEPSSVDEDEQHEDLDQNPKGHSYQLEMENKFYTRVTIGRYGCLLVIDDFSHNMISSYAVEKLGLVVVDHPCPYDMVRYNQPIRVTKQAHVSFSLGTNYEDSILCDIAHMDDCHIHLGQPWKFYRDVSHDPINNYYRFTMGRKFVLVPMTKEYVQQEVESLKVRVKDWLDEKFKVNVIEKVEETVDEDIFEVDSEPVFDNYDDEEEDVFEPVGDVEPIFDTNATEQEIMIGDSRETLVIKGVVEDDWLKNTIFQSTYTILRKIVLVHNKNLANASSLLSLVRFEEENGRRQRKYQSLVDLFEACLDNSKLFMRNMLKIRGRILSNRGRMMQWKKWQYLMKIWERNKLTFNDAMEEIARIYANLGKT